jgi:hypothetical protein
MHFHDCARGPNALMSQACKACVVCEKTYNNDLVVCSILAECEGAMGVMTIPD